MSLLILSRGALGIGAMLLLLTLDSCSSSAQMGFRYTSIEVFAMSWNSTTLVAQKSAFLLDSSRGLHAATLKEEEVLDYIGSRLQHLQPIRSDEDESVMDARIVCLMKAGSQRVDTLTFSLMFAVHYNGVRYQRDTTLIRYIVERLPLQYRKSYQRYYSLYFRD